MLLLSMKTPLSPTPHYAAAPVYDQNNQLVDLIVDLSGKKNHMLGKAGPIREEGVAQAFLASLPENALPVLLGSGIGAALNYILQQLPNRPIAVVDKEEAILELTGLAKNLDPRVCLITDSNPENILQTLTAWQKKQGNLPLAPCVLPFYLRLDKEFYSRLQKELQASRDFNFWQKINYPRFKSSSPRILFLTSQYFLTGELLEACERLGVEHKLLQIDREGMLQHAFIENFLTAVVEFKPDFAVTINHLGLDREGVLTNLLADLSLPLASWFVDNPHLILYRYQGLSSPWVSLFTWDFDNIASLKEAGFKHVFYLPLATTPQRFKPGGSHPAPQSWQSRVSFVGNSMIYKVAQRMKAAKPCKALLTSYRSLARDFSLHSERSIYNFIKEFYPDLLPAYAQLETTERQLAYEAMITWEATRQYRNRCLEKILPFNPLILGDKGWHLTFGQEPFPWRWHEEISYYDELPHFYPHSEINFNCTSQQMKGAVNQRIFDVPAAGAFVLTDWREQMGNLFEPGQEVISYADPEEIPELVEFYLKNPAARQKIALAARKRILAEHTYEHRLLKLIDQMRKVYAT